MCSFFGLYLYKTKIIKNLNILILKIDYFEGRKVPIITDFCEYSEIVSIYTQFVSGIQKKNMWW